MTPDDLKKLRRRIEDRLRKDNQLVIRIAIMLGMLERVNYEKNR